MLPKFVFPLVTIISHFSYFFRSIFFFLFFLILSARMFIFGNAKKVLTLKDEHDFSKTNAAFKISYYAILKKLDFKAQNQYPNYVINVYIH